MTELRFDDQVAVITGAGGGLGACHARLLASRGCRVLVNDPGVTTSGAPGDIGMADAVAADITAAGGVAVADRHSVLGGATDIVTHALDEFGRLDILVNNAGLTGGGPLDEMPVTDWDRIFDTHLQGTVAVTRAAWPHLKAADHARIVMTSSASVFGTPFTSPYVTGKAAIFGFSRAMAQEGRYSGIGVNAIMPAAYTRMTAQLPMEDFRNLLETWFPPEQVSPFVAYLCHEACTITGETFSVGGGRAARVVLGECAGVIGASPDDYVGRDAELLALDGWELPADMTDEVRVSVDHLAPEAAVAFRAIKF
jgi:NAD(P)-dependent dehydrogenase (short-subunit alcohol dehydrogenase family)